MLQEGKSLSVNDLAFQDIFTFYSERNDKSQRPQSASKTSSQSKNMKNFGARIEGGESLKSEEQLTDSKRETQNAADSRRELELKKEPSQKNTSQTPKSKQQLQ